MIFFLWGGGHLGDTNNLVGGHVPPRPPVATPLGPNQKPRQFLQEVNKEIIEKGERRERKKVENTKAWDKVRYEEERGEKRKGGKRRK